MSSIGKINAIQGLRGIAALLVVADHSILQFSQTTRADRVANAHLIHVAETLGRQGVEIFFLISGFVMTVASYEDFKQPNASSGFLWRRIARIVPLYWLITALVVVQIVWQGRPLHPLDLVRSLAFIPYVNDDGTLQPLLRRGWTLNYEMFFYAVFAIALFQRPQRGLSAVIGTLVLLAVVGQLWSADRCIADSCRALSFYLQPVMLYFAGGIVLGAFRVFLQRRNRTPGLRFDNGLGLALVLTAAQAAYISFATASTLTYVAGILYCILATAACALLEDRSEHGRLRVLSLMVGEASYSIYMTHSLFVDPASRLWIRTLGTHWLAAYLAIMVVGTSALGWLTFRCVERPMLRAFRRA
jgi:peptidoglycan/LPS O-acetylase OafA/YrhL